MTRRRFYAPASSLSESGIVELSPEETRHLRDVLRMVSGEPAFVFDGQGHEHECLVVEVGRDFARLKIIGEVEPAKPESPLQLTLAVALLKGEKFDLLVQKTTELGVKRIVPVTTKLADVRLRNEADAGKRVARWQRIALEAAKQSGRAFVPLVSLPLSFAEVIGDDSSSDAIRLMFSEREGQSVPVAIPQPVSLVAIVGSEGGWTDEEIKLAGDNGWRIVTLGGRTLRAETAAIVFTALLQHLFGDLK